MVGSWYIINRKKRMFRVQLQAFVRVKVVSYSWLYDCPPSNLKQPREQSNYPLLSPGCRNEGLTHPDCLKGSIAVWAGDTFSPIVTFPLLSLNLAEPPTTYSLFFAGTPTKTVSWGQYPIYLKQVSVGI